MAQLRVVFLTTSWPRHPGDYAGRFVADLAERVSAAGVDVQVVAPGAYRDFGLAQGNGILANARRRPWAVPPLFASMATAARRAARDADLVHVHWLQNVAPALAARKPIVLQGDVPSPLNPPAACNFHPRCPRFQEGHCDVEDPPLYSFGDGHIAACHYPLEGWPLTEDEMRRPSSRPASTPAEPTPTT